MLDGSGKKRGAGNENAPRRTQHRNTDGKYYPESTPEHAGMNQNHQHEAKIASLTLVETTNAVASVALETGVAILEGIHGKRSLAAEMEVGSLGGR
ncbi:hypothetical protein FGB62_139g121 [Gracilaria domingensis]|nr:hypothetical protein FGB62_139g121 [Gracilaria domingensis]